MQLSFFKLATAYFSVFGGASQALANPLMEVLSITLTGNNYQGTVSNKAFGDRVEVNALRMLNCADPRKATALYRAFEPTIENHFYTINEAEYDRAANEFGYIKEGIAGYIFPSQQPGTTPLFKLSKYTVPISNHFYTISAEERDRAVKNKGYISQGVAGYIYTRESACGGEPFYRLWNDLKNDHFYTVSEEERMEAIVKGNYVDDGQAGFILRQLRF